jgi:hypothetical protein
VDTTAGTVDSRPILTRPRSRQLTSGRSPGGRQRNSGVVCVSNPLSCAGPESLPGWLAAEWGSFSFLTSRLRDEWNRADESKLRAFVKHRVPRFCPDLLQVDLSATGLHMSCLRQALLSRDMKWMRRALQFGDRHASFPLLFCWDDL